MQYELMWRGALGMIGTLGLGLGLALGTGGCTASADGNEGSMEGATKLCHGYALVWPLTVDMVPPPATANEPRIAVAACIDGACTPPTPITDLPRDARSGTSDEFRWSATLDQGADGARQLRVVMGLRERAPGTVTLLRVKVLDEGGAELTVADRAVRWEPLPRSPLVNGVDMGEIEPPGCHNQPVDVASGETPPWPN